uniref:Uncharacterized protein n=1 Tax=viral metagenome TaxID=1070528 RepID=A0A6C0K1R8_9ZZZZ
MNDTISPIPNEIEMKTIRTNYIVPKIPIFKLLQDTRCVKITEKDRFRNTSIILQKGEICWGNITVKKNRVYIDITDCYKCSKGYNTPMLSIYVPIIFGMTGKYMMNICQYNGEIQW